MFGALGLCRGTAALTGLVAASVLVGPLRAPRAQRSQVSEVPWPGNKKALWVRGHLQLTLEPWLGHGHGFGPTCAHSVAQVQAVPVAQLWALIPCQLLRSWGGPSTRPAKAELRAALCAVVGHRVSERVRAGLTTLLLRLGPGTTAEVVGPRLQSFLLRANVQVGK